MARADVIVVGSGPGGCTAARLLGEKGFDVRLFDAACFPRVKPCAGGITLRAKPWLPPGLVEELGRPMRGAVLSSGEGKQTELSSDSDLGWMVRRSEFDLAHLRVAGSVPGVTIHTGVRVTGVKEFDSHVEVESDRGVWEAKVVIGADGVNSVVARCLYSTRTAMAMAQACEGEFRGGDLDSLSKPIFEFSHIAGGYGWVFPKRDHCSVGWYRYPDRGSKPGSVEDFLRARGFDRWERVDRQRGWSIPLGGRGIRLHTNRSLLVGDAAGAVDPLTGEGISYAMQTGHHAAEVVDAHLHEQRSLGEYSRVVNKQVHRSLRWSRRIAGFLYRYPRCGYFLLFQNTFTARKIAEVLIGRHTYGGAVARTLMCWPLYLACCRPVGMVRVDVQK